MIAIKDFKMPRGCYECPFADESIRMDCDYYCQAVKEKPDVQYGLNKPDWCPLVDVPDMNVGKCSEFPNSSDGEYDPKPDIYYLAEKIGIHRLYALVVQLRGEPAPCIDTIGRQAAIDALNKLDVSDGIGISYVVCDLQEEAIRSIENLPSAQPEIIRCKECVYADENYHCDYMTTWNDGDCFCCYGKRRTDG